jgi:hypothetical protein
MGVVARMLEVVVVVAVVVVVVVVSAMVSGTPEVL